MKYGLVYAFVFLFLAGVVSACSCLSPGSPIVELEKSSNVLEGSVINITINEFSKNVTFNVSRILKGNLPSIIAISTPMDSAACGFNFEQGKEYLVYAEGNLSSLTTNLCSRTALLSDADEDVEYFNGCRNLYWIDNENKNCGQKKFCGAFMYYGLQTFETKGECESAGKKNYCTSRPEICTLEYMPVCGSDGETYGNGCGACGVGVEYWTSGECGEQNEKQYFNLSNGRKAEIKIMPETASEKAIERLGEFFKLSRLNFTIVLKEVGTNQVAYELTAEKQGKMLGLFGIKANVSVQVDAETGEVLRTHKPWWAFLASGI